MGLLNFPFLGKVTIRRLKEILSELPSEDQDGEPYEVWVETGEGLSAECLQACALNKDGKGCDIILSPMEGYWDEPTETSDPVQAARWLGRMVEADKAVYPEDQFTVYDEEADDYIAIPIKGKLSGITPDNLWLDINAGEYITVRWPIRLVADENAAKDREP